MDNRAIPTPEEARAELARRRALKEQSVIPTKEEAIIELEKRRGLSPSEEKRHALAKELGIKYHNDSVNKENLGTSLLMAIPRVGYDLGETAIKGIRALPEYLKKIPTEAPGIFNVIQDHPLHALGQGFAGANEGINMLAQAPLNLSQYGSERLHLIPENITNTIKAITPQNTSESINSLFGKPVYPGEAAIRGAFRNIPTIASGAKITSYLNPFKLTDKGIVKSILKAEEENKNKYSGPQGKYNQLEQEASKRGVDLSNIDFNKIPANKIDIPSLTELNKVRTLSQAQKAISDLGHVERRLERQKLGVGLDSAQRQRLKHIQDVKNYIQQNMFKDKSGKTQMDLLNKHKQIQEGYAKEVIPYTKHKAIQDYKRGQLLKDDLVKSLVNGKKFAAQRGQSHKALMLRRWIEKHPKTSIGAGLVGAHAGGIPLGMSIYKYLTGDENGK